jgi:protein-disulfide isomerase
LERAGQQGGLSQAQVEACLNDQGAADAMQARIQHYVDNDKISVTPTFVINGKKIEGAATPAELDAAIAAAR